MYPCAHSEIPRGNTNACFQITRQIYKYIDKYNRIHPSTHENNPVCERHGMCQVCLCRARIYQPGILRNHAAWSIDSQCKAASVPNTNLKLKGAFEQRDLMLVSATLNKEGKCSAFYEAFLCMSLTDCWMQCMTTLQSSWNLHSHVRDITDDWPCCILFAFCKNQWNYIDTWF